MYINKVCHASSIQPVVHYKFSTIIVLKIAPVCNLLIAKCEAESFWKLL
jgi:hypothetical protein